MDEYYSYPYLQICVDACFFAGDRDTGLGAFLDILGGLGWGGGWGEMGSSNNVHFYLHKFLILR